MVHLSLPWTRLLCLLEQVKKPECLAPKNWSSGDYYGTHSERIGSITTLRPLGATQDTAEQLGYWKLVTIAEITYPIL